MQGICELEAASSAAVTAPLSSTRTFITLTTRPRRSNPLQNDSEAAVGRELFAREQRLPCARIPTDRQRAG
jgi:hypothetical protein